MTARRPSGKSGFHSHIFDGFQLKSICKVLVARHPPRRASSIVTRSRTICQSSCGPLPVPLPNQIAIRSVLHRHNPPNSIPTHHSRRADATVIYDRCSESSNTLAAILSNSKLPSRSQSNGCGATDLHVWSGSE